MKQYETMKDGENLEWCKPFCTTIEGVEYWLIEENGEATVMKIGDTVTYTPTKEQLSALASTVNPYHDFYDGYTSLHIATAAMKERGCLDCPFCDICDAMQEEAETDLYFPDDEYADGWFGGDSPCCLTYEDIKDVASWRGMSPEDAMSELHKATDDELREYAGY